MTLNSPASALDQDAVALFRAEMPPGIIPVEQAALAENIAGASPFLRQLMLRDPAFAGRVFGEDANELLAQQLAELRGVAPTFSQAQVVSGFDAPLSFDHFTIAKRLNRDTPGPD